MLVSSMNSKRQRRPNVRLGEIGDFSAALYCGNYQKHKQNLDEKRWEQELGNPRNSGSNLLCGFLIPRSEQTVADTGVSSRAVVDIQQNRMKRNRNSLKSPFDFGSSDEATKPGLDFGTVTRKCRYLKRVKRRGRSSCGNSFGVGGAWVSRVYPEIDDGGSEFFDPIITAGLDNSAVDDLKDSFDREMLDTSKDALENQWVEPVPEERPLGGFDECWMMGDDSNKCDALYYNNPESSGDVHKIGPGVNTVNSVREWLEGLGFGMYAGLFELHEVDEQVLPLLTFEDLKDMGISTVGPRRKLYSAIQLLKGGVSV